MLRTIGIVAALAVAAFSGYVLSQGSYFSGESNAAKKEAKTGPQWVAAAPGRVEPGSGEVNIGAAILGQVADVTVKLNDKVEEGELLIRLDDEEARARLAAAEAEAGLRKRQRDAETSTSGRENVTRGEDAVYSSEREVIGARFELDAALTGKRRGETTDQQLAEARRRLAKAQERVERERLAYAQAQAKPNLPSPNQAESALTAARANVALAASQLDKSRIRSPRAGSVLQLNAKKGEIVAPSPEQPLAVVGDVSVLRVKAEVDDGDVAKIRVGQKAFVRSINYPGREFEGTVADLAPTMDTPRISARGPRRPSDIEVLEMTINLVGDVPLLPGMRVDAFVRPDR
ncbi:MAG: HlyD family efflux transporter periplasmic adaptor subunit [Hyphomicrobium sp.]|jgi:HlyD family secretion protein